jgi:restriction system protein
MSGRNFEISVAKLFKRAGFEVEICKQGGDGGVDLLLKKDGDISCVQCKAHNNKISPSVARDLLGTMLSLQAIQGYLVTFFGGTQGTIDFCKKNNLILWDIEDILKFQDSL